MGGGKLLMRGRWLFHTETTILLAFRGAWRGRVSLSSLYPSLVSCHPVLDGKVTAQSPRQATPYSTWQHCIRCDVDSDFRGLSYDQKSVD